MALIISRLIAVRAAFRQAEPTADWLIPTLLVIALLIALGALLFFAMSDWRRYRGRGTRQGYRHRRSAHERFASARAAARSTPSAGPPERRRPPPAVASDDEDDLLRDLLGQSEQR